MAKGKTQKAIEEADKQQLVMIGALISNQKTEEVHKAKELVQIEVVESKAAITGLLVPRADTEARSQVEWTVL